MKLPSLPCVVFALLLAATDTSAQALKQASESRGPGTWQALAGMPTPRAAHSATRLRDGRVLLAGGCHADGCEEGISTDALLFDPRDGKFRSTGAPQQARVGHRAVGLRDGSVLLLGGWTDAGASAEVERYDPASGRFTRHGALKQARDGFTATALDDGNILVAGGYHGAMQRLASAEIYDPRTRTSRAVGAMATSRMSHTATLLADGRVLIAGGSSARGQLLDTIEIYDPRSGRFSAAGRMHKARHKHAALRIGPDVLLLGGAGIDEAREQYADSERWRPGHRMTLAGPVMHDGRYKFVDALAVLGDGSVLIAGSARTPERLDLRSMRITPLRANLGGDLSFTTATPLADGRVLVAGGYDPRLRVHRQAWLFDPRHDPKSASK